MKPTVYLCGPITGCTFGQCTDWREYAVERLAEFGVRGLSPMRHKDYLLKETRIADAYPGEVLSSQRGIMTRDFWDSYRCDAVIANFDGAEKVSIGSVMEIAWAHAFRKPLAVVMSPDNVHNHSMIREAAGFVLPTLDEAIAVVGALFS